MVQHVEYSVEYYEWGEWRPEEVCPSEGIAREFGTANYPYNTWRVVRLDTGQVVHQHDPTSLLEADAASELHRFHETVRWREFFAERDRRLQQQPVLHAVASRHRHEQARREQARREQDRRERLQGFRFVGVPPSVLERPPPTVADLFDDGEERGDGVNWRKEGF